MVQRAADDGTGDAALTRLRAMAGRDRPVLIAGTTASGKSALALALAEDSGGVIVNADALQVYGAWRALTARPGPGDLARAPHLLYGHVDARAPYSVGHWLAEVAPILTAHRDGNGPRPIIIGGTGLNMTALTTGLSDIPATPAPLRARADAIRLARGHAGLLADLDAATRARIDTRNPMRVQRAWEVLMATGRGLADWQDETGPPLLPLAGAAAVVIDPPPAALSARIAGRFDAMLADGALDEVRAARSWWDPALPAARAIGAPELMAHLAGTLTLDAARTAAVTATRQYAKRQRNWLRGRLGDWARLS